MATILDIYQSSGLPLRRKTSNEFAGQCPCCGGEDRFLLWPQARDANKFPEGNFYCRQCRVSGGSEKLERLLGSGAFNSSSSASRSSSAKHFYKANASPSPEAAPSPIDNEGYLRIVQEARDRLPKESAPIKLAQHYLKARGIEPLRASSEFGLGFIAFAEEYTPLKPTEKRPRLPIGISIPSYRNGNLVSVKVRTLTGDATNNSGYYHKYALLKNCPQVPYILIRNELGNTPILIVESELDAILLAQHTGKLFNYIALGSASAKPDVDVAKLIKSAAKVYFCADYDAPGMEAFERWRKTYPKIQLSMLPKGKDPTDAWEVGLDLKKWAEELRMGTKPPITSREQKFRYTSAGSHDELCSFLQTLRDAKCKRVAVEFDQAHGIIAFSDGDMNTIVGRPEELDIDWTADMEDFTLVSFDPALLYRDMPELRTLKLHGILTLFHAVTGNGKSMDLAELSSKYLGHRGGLPDFGSSKSLSAEHIVAGNARAVAALTPILQEIPKPSSAPKYYGILFGSSKALGEIMENGLPIDWDQFERDGGVEKAKDIWAHRDEDGRVRGQFTLYGAITGRIICSSPNLQGFPNELKHTVIAPQGRVLVDADYRQSEMRIAAILAKDEAMLRIFIEGGDIHRETAARVLRMQSDLVTHEQRQIGKAVNFGFLYGQTSKGLQDTLEGLGISKSREDCNALQIAFNENYPLLCRWRDQILQVCRGVDRTVTSFPPTGVRTALRRHIPIYTLDYRHKTKVVNYTVQGSGAELTLQVLSMLPERLAGLDAKIIHCIHDEFLLETSEQDAKAASLVLTQTMTDAFMTLFPGTSTDNLLECGMGKTWATAKNN